ncbi:hypothetical protein Ddc_11231 [Ditylenchus destructor]|nr:hypothetical protein Ddc_11231 [Ditylenchus destructor]
MATFYFIALGLVFLVGSVESRSVPVEVVGHKETPLSITVADDHPKNYDFYTETEKTVLEEMPGVKIMSIHQNKAQHPDQIGRNIGKNKRKAKNIAKVFVKLHEPKGVKGKAKESKGDQKMHEGSQKPENAPEAQKVPEGGENGAQKGEESGEKGAGPGTGEAEPGQTQGEEAKLEEDKESAK